MSLTSKNTLISEMDAGEWDGAGAVVKRVLRLEQIRNPNHPLQCLLNVLTSCKNDSPLGPAVHMRALLLPMLHERSGTLESLKLTGGVALHAIPLRVLVPYTPLWVIPLPTVHGCW